MGYENLPYTGAASLVVGGVVIDTPWLFAAAAAMVAVGILVRIGFRRGKRAGH